jgi:translation elongation factor EF-Tu-like GTPase
VIAVLLNAVVTFLSTDQGGRITAPASGYRPPVWFGDTDASGEPLLWDVEFQFKGAHADAEAPFDQEVPALMRAVSATPSDVAVAPGARFEVREGARVVGRGRVVEIVSE